MSPGFAFANTPSSPRTTSTTSGPSGSTVITTSAPRAASATLAQITPPAEANLSRVAAVRLDTTTSKSAEAPLAHRTQHVRDIVMSTRRGDPFHNQRHGHSSSLRFNVGNRTPPVTYNGRHLCVKSHQLARKLRQWQATRVCYEYRV